MPNFREFILGPRPTIGSWLQLADPAIAEMMASAGFDWLTIDLEHTSTSVADMGRLIRVIDLAGCRPLVRLSAHDPAQIKRALDAGARGIIAPMVNTADEARRIVDASRYPPRGSRGVGLARAQGYGTDFEAYRVGDATDVVVLPQIEHVDGVANLEAILDVEGVDGFFVGPYDLSGSLGRPGDFEHPDVKAALAEIDRFVGVDGSVAGIHVVEPDLDELAAALDRGYRFVAFASEMLFLAHRLRRVGAALDGLRG